MSYKAEIQLAIHLHSFKNIQIERQGYAAIRLQIIDQSSSNYNYALPYNVIPYHKKFAHAQEPILDDCGFQSSTIRIQYQDQKYTLNNIVQFKLLIQSLPKLASSQIYLKYTLLFSNLHSLPKNGQPMESSVYGMQQIFIKLEKIQTGIFHYYHQQFTQNYASAFDFTIFSMITDFKLYPYSMRMEVIEIQQRQKKRQKDRQKVVDFEDLLQWMAKYIKNCSQPIKYLVNTYAKTLRYNTYILRSRINDYHRNKKQLIELKLPAYYLKQKQLQSDKVQSKQFYEFYTNFDPFKVSLKQFKDDIYNLHQDNFFYVQEIAQGMANNMFDTKKLAEEFQKFISDQAYARTVKTIKYGHQLTNTSHVDEVKMIANKIRKQKKLEDMYPLIKVEPQDKINQYLFYQACYSKQLQGKDIEKIKNQFNIAYDQRNMVIVLCHGFQASSLDMRIIQRGIKEALPLAQILVSTANQSDTQININQMGSRLAAEIHRFIKVQGLNPAQIILNFVGHSMGGVIARSSLIYLPQFQKRLGFFCSFSTPHLGYLNGTDGMIKTGLWFMRKMKQTKSLDQLSLADASSTKNTFLYQLSKTGSLKNFKKIILVSSAEDSYVPWHSARISGYKSSRNSSKIQTQMAENIVGDNTVHRIDINFSCKKNDIDGFIGRKAHINFITNETIMKLINKVIPKLFDLRQI